MGYVGKKIFELEGPPDNRELASQLLLTYEMAGELSLLADSKRRYAFVNVWGDFERSQDVEAVISVIQKNIDKMGLQAAIGSEYALWVAQTDYLVRGKIISWLQALGLVLLIVAVLYKSWRASMLVLVPVFVTTAIVLATMAILDIPLDISSTVITSITIGVGADFAIHLLDRIMAQQKAGATAATAAELGLRQAASPILVDTGTNVLGFSAFLLAPLLPIEHAGLMLVLSMLLSCIAALVIVPLLAPLLLGQR